MGKKTLGRKIKLAVAHRKADPSPRWIDIKVYGLQKARFRSLKRFRSRHWRRSSKLKI
ncbi:MAG: 50S ribosomal protein L39e [Candidatus Aenigmarchaeota archaeon]|nr:50S ribosomal protein L39e [Candidatus Aenigmarchaeota archaeon]MCK5176104.1 50S ribosomal protein L39e [Candidatus Aenigmarchaeota archaeon]